MTAPRPVTEIDDELARVIRRYHRLRWWGVIALALVVVLALSAGGMALVHKSRQLSASCALSRDLSSLPVTPSPPVRRPSKLGITIVVDSRIAYLGECGRDIPPPDPSLVRWAHYYRMAVPG